jgi:hypothetical protein
LVNYDLRIPKRTIFKDKKNPVLELEQKFTLKCPLNTLSSPIGDLEKSGIITPEGYTNSFDRSSMKPKKAKREMAQIMFEIFNTPCNSCCDPCYSIPIPL